MSVDPLNGFDHLIHQFECKVIDDEEAKPKEDPAPFKTDSGRIANDVFTFQKLVKHLLETSTASRDNDLYLYHNLLRHMGRDPSMLPSRDLFARMQDATLPHFFAVVMLRRRLQETHPELRGHLYQIRLTYEKDADKTLNSIVPGGDKAPVDSGVS